MGGNSWTAIETSVGPHMTYRVSSLLLLLLLRLLLYVLLLLMVLVGIRNGAHTLRQWPYTIDWTLVRSDGVVQLVVDDVT